MTPPVSGGVPEQGPEAIEAIRSDEAVRDAFVDCYTLRSIVDDEIAKFPDSGTYDAVKRGEDWDRVEASLVRAILARAALERPRPALRAPGDVAAKVRIEYYGRDADPIRLDDPAPVAAPDGPWFIMETVTRPARWHLEKSHEPNAGGFSFDTEAEAIAVRDALNRVAGGSR